MTGDARESLRVVRSVKAGPQTRANQSFAVVAALGFRGQAGVLNDSAWVIDHSTWTIDDPTWTIDDPTWMTDPTWMIDEVNLDDR
jgi:hypothetical protein